MKRRRIFKSYKSGLWWWEEFWAGRWRKLSPVGNTAPFLCVEVRQLFQTGGMRSVKGSGSIRCELMRQEGGEVCQECRCLCRTPFSRLASLGRLECIKAAGAACWSLRPKSLCFQRERENPKALFKQLPSKRASFLRTRQDKASRSSPDSTPLFTARHKQPPSMFARMGPSSLALALLVALFGRVSVSAGVEGSSGRAAALVKVFFFFPAPSAHAPPPVSLSLSPGGGRPRLQRAVPVPRGASRVPARREPGARRLWLLPGVRQAAGRAVHRAGPLRPPQGALLRLRLPRQPQDRSVHR